MLVFQFELRETLERSIPGFSFQKKGAINKWLTDKRKVLPISHF